MNWNTFYRISEPQDVELLAPNLRDGDVEELKVSTGHTPLEALETGLHISDLVWTLFSNGVPVCMGGVAPFPQASSIGISWMLASDGLLKSAVALQWYMPEWLEQMHSLYPCLGNWVDARNETSIRWLERLGFTRVGTCEEYGVGRMPFHWYMHTSESGKLTRKERKLSKCVPQTLQA